MCLKLHNHLDVDMNAHFIIEDGQDRVLRGAGHKCDNDKYASRVRCDDYLPLDMRGLGDSYKLILRVKGLLSRNERKGIKISPGSGMGNIHDINFLVKGDQLLIIIEFTERPSAMESHVDPDIYHPDQLGDIGILD